MSDSRLRGTSPQASFDRPLAKTTDTHQDTPPNALACDHDWRQVSWLAGQCLFTAFPDRAVQWLMAKGSPLTVAGAAAESGLVPKNLPSPHSLLIPEGNRRDHD